MEEKKRKNKERKKEVTTLDIKLQVASGDGVAYFRISKELKEFLTICNKKHGIIGFEYEEDSFNFGVILGSEFKLKKEE